MAGDKRAQIVIKKITVVSGGAHGGAWKVAFADFMTAMMAFFLVMWLVAQSSPQTKKAVADYFSTPSVIEYNFSNFGVQITLEKLFLDLINEPLKTLQTFMDPMDKTPNVLAMGMKKVVKTYLSDELSDIDDSIVEVANDSAMIEIPDTELFERGKSSTNGAQYAKNIEKLKGVLIGLEDADLVITSIVYKESVIDNIDDPDRAQRVSEERVNLLANYFQPIMENGTVDISTHAEVQRADRSRRRVKGIGGWIRFELQQKRVQADGYKPRPLADDVFGRPKKDKSVYDNFVDQVSKRRPAGGGRSSSKNKAGDEPRHPTEEHPAAEHPAIHE